jgi:hypothetical protein
MRDIAVVKTANDDDRKGQNGGQGNGNRKCYGGSKGNGDENVPTWKSQGAARYLLALEPQATSGHMSRSMSSVECNSSGRGEQMRKSRRTEGNITNAEASQSRLAMLREGESIRTAIVWCIRLHEREITPALTAIYHMRATVCRGVPGGHIVLINAAAFPRVNIRPARWKTTSATGTSRSPTPALSLVSE